MTDAVSAIIQHFATLNTEGKQNLLKQLGVSDIHGLMLIRPEVAEKYCKTHHINLGDVSVWNNQGNEWREQKYAEAKTNWENEYAKYQDLKDLLAQQKTKQKQAYEKYMTLFTKQQNAEGGVSSSEVNNAMKNYSLSSRNVTDTEIDMNVSLDMQRVYNTSQSHFIG